MNLKYQTVLLFVKEITRSRDFYERILQQTVKYDFGEDIVFQSGFAIHDANHIYQTIFRQPNPPAGERPEKAKFELYFECDELDHIFARLRDYGIPLIHNIEEQPWGQRVFRFYDPDSHIIEIGEPMALVIKRLLKAGIPEMDVSRRTSMPLEEVKKIKSEIDLKT